MSDSPVIPSPIRLPALGRYRGLVCNVAGIAGLLFIWWVGGRMVANSPGMYAFSLFAPGPALSQLWEMLWNGEVNKMTWPSLYRVGLGLFFAIVIGVPVGIAIGRIVILRDVTNIPFQFLRMISPLSWMPIAVMAFATWDAAIIFLITVAAVWPIMFATAAGLRRLDPAWLKVARNLGASPWHQLTTVILPAIATDILTGIRLALGVAWIVLVPAEYLGVTSGLGYAINDARDTLDYSRLAATVVVIGVIGFFLDYICLKIVQHLNWVRES